MLAYTRVCDTNYNYLELITNFEFSCLRTYVFSFYIFLYIYLVYIKYVFSFNKKNLTEMTSSLITLMCDNALFTIDREMLTAHPNTMLGRMFGSSIEIARANERGHFEVAAGISQSMFRDIMKFYTDGIIQCPSTISIQELHKACDFLMIPFDLTTIRCQNLCEYRLSYRTCIHN